MQTGCPTWSLRQRVLIGLFLIVSFPALASGGLLVTNTNDSGPGSFREAIEQANSFHGWTEILFDIPGPGPFVIQLASPLPPITDEVFIGPRTKTHGEVVLDGTNAGSGAIGLDFQVGSKVFGTGVQGITVRFFSGKGVSAKGVSIFQKDVTITDCNTGMDFNACDGCTVESSRVSGNLQAGISIGGGSTNLVIFNTKIGTNADGTAAQPNGGGILIFAPANGIYLNSDLISGNNATGLYINGSNVSVERSKIGTNASGLAALPNGFDGVVMQDAINSKIGFYDSSTFTDEDIWELRGLFGLSADPPGARRNIIAGKFTGGPANGITIVGGSGNIVANNLINLDYQGINTFLTATCISLTNGANNDIIAENFMAGCRSGAIALNTSNNNTIRWNFVGLNVPGTIIGNFGNNAIGLTSSSGNMVLGNFDLKGGQNAASAGLSVFGASATSNYFAGNAIDQSATKGIQLLSGGNNNQAFPVLTSANTAAGQTTISGSLTSAPSTSYQIGFFASPTCDSTGSGEGLSPLGVMTVTTDGSGSAPFTFNTPTDDPPVRAGQVVTATATKLVQGNPTDTSEFSACRSVTGDSTSSDLSVTKDSPGVSSVAPGETITYSIKVRNNGPDTASPVRITDEMGLDMQFSSLFAPAGWNCTTPGVGTRGFVECTTSSLAPGAEATFELVLKLHPSTNDRIASNNVTIRGTKPDPDRTNNRAFHRILVEPNITIGDASGMPGGDVQFPVTLSAPASVPVLVPFTIQDGSATAAQHYYNVSPMLVIPAGQTSGLISVPTRPAGSQARSAPEAAAQAFTFTVTTAPVNAKCGACTATGTINANTPGFVGNVSTRLPVGAGDDALIEGFIVQGPNGSTKKIIVRALGPFLTQFGITDALANPLLEIHDATGATVATNNDWKQTQLGGLITGDQVAEITGSGLAPTNDLESAIIANLAPGSYTAVVRGVNNTTGTGIVDAFDLSASSSARLANIATRGFIQGGDKLMIAGFIIQNAPVQTVVRAIGPSLVAFGINNALPDTTLQLRDQNGAIVLENDNWKSSQQQQLEATGLQPTHDLEAALVTTIQPGQYTAQVRGKNDVSGTGVVEIYFLQ